MDRSEMRLTVHEVVPIGPERGGYHDRQREEIISIGLQHGLGGRVLDLGCAAGAFGEQLLTRGLCDAVVGVETEPGPAARAAERLTTVVRADLNDLSLAERLPHPFDVMIFADVLEHLIDPLPVLRSFVDHLSPDGLCIVSVPNVRYYRVTGDLILRNDWQYREQGVLDRTHLRFFTAKSAARLCESAGLRILSSHAPLARRAARLAHFAPATTSWLSAQVVLVCRPGRREQSCNGAIAQGFDGE